MKRRGLLIVLSGFSGAGKGTVMKSLLQKYDNYALSISATTRQPRPGEVDGREYFFKTREEFEQMIVEDKLLEHAQYVGNYYGTPRDYVEHKLEDGFDVILEIEIQGALKVKEKFPDTVLMFLMPPTADELKKRLEGRGTEDEATIKKRLLRAVEESQGVEEYDEETIIARLRKAAKESEGVEKYDYIVINDVLDDCVEQIHEIIGNEHCKASNNLEKINQFRDELTNMWKGDIR